jgi:hypothetical protein
MRETLHKQNHWPPRKDLEGPRMPPTSILKAREFLRQNCFPANFSQLNRSLSEENKTPKSIKTSNFPFGTNRTGTNTISDKIS